MLLQRLCLVAALASFALVARAPAAPLLTFNPAGTVVSPGDPVSIELVISGLGNMQPDSLSGFDFDVTFNASVLAFVGAIFGDPVQGNQLDQNGFGTFSDVFPGVGFVNLFELSFDSPGDLDTLQLGSFVLGTLNFSTTGVGSSSLGLDNVLLADSFGSPLAVGTQSASVQVQVTAIPEPASLGLVGLGLLGAAALLRRRWNRH